MLLDRAQCTDTLLGSDRGRVVPHRLLQRAELAIGLGQRRLQLGAVERGIATAGLIQLVEIGAQAGMIAVQADLRRLADLLGPRHRFRQRRNEARPAATAAGTVARPAASRARRSIDRRPRSYPRHPPGRSPGVPPGPHRRNPDPRASPRRSLWRTAPALMSSTAQPAATTPRTPMRTSCTATLAARFGRPPSWAERWASAAGSMRPTWQQFTNMIEGTTGSWSRIAGPRNRPPPSTMPVSLRLGAVRGGMLVVDHAVGRDVDDGPGLLEQCRHHLLGRHASSPARWVTS